MKKPPRDLPITPNLTIDREWCAGLGLPVTKTNKQEEAQQAVASILWRHHKTDPGIATSYPRNNNATTHDDRLTPRTLPPAVDRLVDAGLVIGEKARRGDLGRQSTMLPSQNLIEKFDQQPPPRIRLKPGPLVRLRDEHKNGIVFRRTEQVRQFERDLRPINEMSSSCRLEVPGLVKIEGTALAVWGIGKSIVDTDAVRYHRIFNNGSFEFGGRLYGHYAQSISKALRSRLRLNGEACKEHDYPSFHCRLILALCGRLAEATDLDRDPYFVDGWERKYAKVAFNVIVNSTSAGLAKIALARRIAGFRLKRELEDGENPRTEEFAIAEQLLADALHAYAWARPYHFSGFGLRLQRLDSDLMIRVALKLIQMGITALFIHDSVVAMARHYDAMRDAMNDELMRLLAELADRSKTTPLSSGENRAKTITYDVSEKEMFLHNGVSGSGVVVGSVSVLSGGLGVGVVLGVSSGASTGGDFAGGPRLDPGGLFPIDLTKDLPGWAGGTLPLTVRAAVLHETKARGMTQDQLAARLGISRPQLTNALRGRFGLGKQAAGKLREFLAC